eukprot:1727430-Prymnesium_polylepis.1
MTATWADALSEGVFARAAQPTCRDWTMIHRAVCTRTTSAWYSMVRRRTRPRRASQVSCPHPGRSGARRIVQEDRGAASARVASCHQLGVARHGARDHSENVLCCQVCRSCGAKGQQHAFQPEVNHLNASGVGKPSERDQN